MNSRLPPYFAAVTFAAFFAVAPSASTFATESLARIAAHPTHYAFEGRGYTDLNTLEAAVRARPHAVIELQSCSASAARAWSAAAARFADRTLRLRMTGSGDGCAPTVIALPVSARDGLPSGIDDAAVRRYWEQVAP